MQTLSWPCKPAQLPLSCPSLPSPNLSQPCSHWQSQDRLDEPCKTQNSILAGELLTQVMLSQLLPEVRAQGHHCSDSIAQPNPPPPQK